MILIIEILCYFTRPLNKTVKDGYVRGMTMTFVEPLHILD
jgi:hypothetical protein